MGELAFLLCYVLVGLVIAASVDYRWQARGWVATPLIVCLWPLVLASVGLILTWHVLRNSFR